MSGAIVGPDENTPGKLADDEGGTFVQNLRRLPVLAHNATFRTGAATSDRARMLKVFGNLWMHVHSTRIHVRSLRFAATMGLGVAALAAFLVATVTGILLMVYYTPSVEGAYASVKDIHYVVPTGRFIRNVHRWSAHVMVIAVMAHGLRVFLTASYKKPREFNWVVGLGLLAVTLGLSFTGYLLPWDQLAFWAATIGANIAASPRELTDALGVTQYADIGGLSKTLLLGANDVGQPALVRFYLLHVMVLPLATVALVALHFWRIRKDGGLARPTDAQLRATGELPEGAENPNREAFPKGSTKTYGLMALVKGRTPWVGRGPENTVPAYPNALRAEVAVGMVVVMICLLLAVLSDAPLKEMANAAIPENPAKAPWYFLGVQELVSYSAFMGGVALPGLAMVGLAFIPFLDREREPGGVWFSGKLGTRVFVLSALLGFVVTVGIEVLVIRYGWLRNWFPDIHQLWIIALNAGTIMTAAFAAWSFGVLRKTRSTRMAALSLVSAVLVGFLVLTWIGTIHRGPNWDFFWSQSEWPKH
jgi:quinol-cytochrome oxidoreductase complex cytochrome b subunit